MGPPLTLYQRPPAKIIPVVKDAINELIVELRRGHDEALVEVLHLKDATVEVGKLFDLGRGIEEVMFKTVKFRWDVTRYFDEWAEMRGEKERFREKPLKRCLRRHIAAFEERIRWRVRERDREEVNMQMERCRDFLIV